MTFRFRLVLAATVAVAIAVLLASLAAFLVSRNALVSSIDDSLSVRAADALHTGHLDTDGAGFYGEKACLVPAGATQGNCPLPVNSQVQQVANGSGETYFTTVVVDGQQYRQIATPIPGEQAALLLATPLAGVNSQLDHLAVALGALALAGVVLAILLGWLVGRTALGPLNDLTATIERIADTTDVTERLEPGGVDELGRLRRAFNRMLAALEDSRESQRQLVLDASHELRTPLTSLRTNLEVVRRIDELPPDDREVLVGDVLTQLGELTNLVADLAELARGEHRQVEAAPFRLDQLVEDAVAVAATHGRTRGVEVRAELAETWVEGQPDRILRAVGNLIDNAIKWSPDHGLVEVTCHGGEVTVRDHGPGIAPEDRPFVFDRFYRAPAARGLPGSGLGLAIVAQVAHDERGSVAVDEAAGGGALFTLQLPTIEAPSVLPLED